MGAAHGTPLSPRVGPGPTRAVTAPPSRSSPRRHNHETLHLSQQLASAAASHPPPASARAKRRLPVGPPPTTVRLVSQDLSTSAEFELNNVNARAIEETFKLVRCHVEGDDHSVAFPNKQTGLYERLNGRAVYTVHGHTYHPNETWKTRPKVDRHHKLTIPKDEAVIEGELLRLHKGLFSKKWVNYYFVVKYPGLQMFEKQGDKKPKAELTIDRSIKVSTVDMGTQHPFAFMINGDEATWYLSPASALRREEWMIWLQTMSVFQAPASWKDDDESTPPPVPEPKKTLQAVTAADLEGHNSEPTEQGSSRNSHSSMHRG
eukprot:TRINITY_DN5000_c0_g2_i1.p1 TRINITY_DN5000_c0_g2~~TRINITY_DN5000_c0_g2_i1.p1  ORF type:complete len:318 (+),score=18.27 TRINITY_DN5000_c0_g2_i1:204-1157(+)